MLKAEQGNILKIASIQYPVLVVSKNFFNESGLVMACPILPNAVAGPLRIRCKSVKTKGFVYCDQLRVVDLNNRRFSITDCISLPELMDIVDTIQGIFDYI
ncbi:MAG: type II toxin-antitoxin system PemK/MazF family toxin [Clostridia bacterium]|nr:type II toxin-antitoxin system PemK/MazF family toxin [Clostridia bacterium]